MIRLLRPGGGFTLHSPLISWGKRCNVYSTPIYWGKRANLSLVLKNYNVIKLLSTIFAKSVILGGLVNKYIIFSTITLNIFSLHFLYFHALGATSDQTIQSVSTVSINSRSNCTQHPVCNIQCHVPRWALCKHLNLEQHQSLLRAECKRYWVWGWCWRIRGSEFQL